MVHFAKQNPFIEVMGSVLAILSYMATLHHYPP